MTNLRKQIDTLNSQMTLLVPTPTLEAFAQSIAQLKEEKIEQNAFKVGDTIPNASLQNTNGETVELYKLLNQHEKLIIAFFRGSWCPYCSLELRALQQHLNSIEKKGVKLIAISPQIAEFNKTVSNDNKLTFDVLTDTNNHLAKTLGISFQLQDFVVPHYIQMGINLNLFNGNDDNSLPMPAVLIVDRNKHISYSFVDSNYMNRVDIDELIAHL